jgi:hypothetical protein
MGGATQSERVGWLVGWLRRDRTTGMKNGEIGPHALSGAGIAGRIRARDWRFAEDAERMGRFPGG